MFVSRSHTIIHTNNIPVAINHYLCLSQRCFSCRSLHGRLFYKRRPLQIPHGKLKNYRKKWLELSPQKRGICEKVFVMQPRKPGSGLRRVAFVRLSTGRRVLVFIPGTGHNLNIHSVVLVEGGRVHDLPGCNLKAIRGVFDLLPVKGRMSSRSKYGIKMTPEMKQHQLQLRYKHEWITTNHDRNVFNELKWSTWVSKDKTTPLLRRLNESDPVPEPRAFNYRWKFIQWLKKQEHIN